MSAVVCRDVTQHFGDLSALDSVSLEVHTGEILGIIGPNGAGKTTLLSRIEGLAKPTSGGIEVLGLDPIADAHALSLRTGVQLQQAALPPRLKVGEALELFSSFYPRAQPWCPRTGAPGHRRQGGFLRGQAVRWGAPAGLHRPGPAP